MFFDEIGKRRFDDDDIQQLVLIIKAMRPIVAAVEKFSLVRHITFITKLHPKETSDMLKALDKYKEVGFL